MKVTLPSLSLEALAPAVWAARRDEIEVAQAAGWTFRQGHGSRAVFVADDRKGCTAYAESIPDLLFQLTLMQPKGSHV